MSLEFNKVIVMGRLADKPRELKLNMPSGDKSASITLVENVSRKAPAANFLPITLFGKMAERALKKLKKGQQVLVEGTLYHSRFKSPKIEKSLNVLRKALKGSTDPEVVEALKSLQGLEWRDKTAVGVYQLKSGLSPMSNLVEKPNAEKELEQGTALTKPDEATS